MSNFHVGDIITFPHWREGHIEISGGTMRSSSGAPGYWRVLSLNADGTPGDMKQVPDKDAETELREQGRLSQLCWEAVCRATDARRLVG